ncbi:MAG: response regulator [Bdellovibrionales bacterium]|nr:response regulator [Bdellovibrionales bacterium]
MTQDQVKVLLVDDDTNFLKVTKQTLENKGCIVKTAKSSIQAMSVILNEIVHLVFVDCVLLADSGTSLVQKIRDAVGQSVEIILMSGIVSSRSIDNCIQKNSCGFFKKPLGIMDIDRALNRVRNEMLQGVSDNILVRYFGDTSSEEYQLKYLVSLNQVKGFEFFLILSQLLKFKESFTIQFDVKGKHHTASVKKNSYVDYITDDTEKIFQILLDEKILTKKEKSAALSADMKKITEYLVETGRASPHQVANIKRRLFFEGLKSLIDQKIKICVDLSQNVKEWFHVSQSDFSDEVFNCLGQQPLSEFQSLVDEYLLEFSVTQIKECSYLPIVSGLSELLKDGLKISKIKSSKCFSSPEEFYKGLFYIFLKGGINITKLLSDREHKYILERYKKLGNFLNQTDPEEVFQFMGALSVGAMRNVMQTDVSQVTKIYHKFMTFNHVDKMPVGLSTEIVDRINFVSSKVKEYQKILTEKDIQVAREREHKDQQAMEVMETHKKQKVCQELLEKEKYKEGFQVLSTVSDKMMNGELKCKLLYLWIAFQEPSAGTDEDKKSRFFHDISIAPPQLRKSSLYFYVMGLFYMTTENEGKAISCFKHAQLYDLSFKPAHKAFREAMLQQNQKKSKKGLKGFMGGKNWQKTG